MVARPPGGRFRSAAPNVGTRRVRQCRVYKRHGSYIGTDPVDLRLRGLHQRLQRDVQVLLELATDRQRYVAEHCEDVRLHRPMHRLVLRAATDGRASQHGREHMALHDEYERSPDRPVRYQEI